MGGRGPSLCPPLLPYITPSDSAPVRIKLVLPWCQVTQSQHPFWLSTHAPPQIPHSFLVLETAFLPVQGHEGFQHWAFFLFPFPLCLYPSFFPGCRTHWAPGWGSQRTEHRETLTGGWVDLNSKQIIKLILPMWASPDQQYWQCWSEDFIGLM